MQKMYSNKPIVKSIEVQHELITTDANRIKFLEDRVRQLTEQVNKMASALALNSRQIRRQNSDINNVNSVIRNRTT